LTLTIGDKREVDKMFLKMENIVKDFGVVRALDHASLKVEEGEIHGLLGENGAGKSTLMNILAGILRPTEGAIYINGVLQENMTTKKSMEAGIRFIHQELNSINDLLVYENLFIGEEIHDKGGFLNKKTMIEKSKEVFIRMGIDMLQMIEGILIAAKIPPFLTVLVKVVIIMLAVLLQSKKEKS